MLPGQRKVIEGGIVGLGNVKPIAERDVYAARTAAAQTETPTPADAPSNVGKALREFCYGTPAIVRGSWDWGERTFKAGDRFPYQKLGIGVHQLRGLFAAGRIYFEAQP